MKIKHPGYCERCENCGRWLFPLGVAGLPASRYQYEATVRAAEIIGHTAVFREHSPLRCRVEKERAPR